MANVEEPLPEDEQMQIVTRLSEFKLNTNLTICDTRVLTMGHAVEVIRNLASEQRPAATTVVQDHILKKQSEADRVLVEWHELVGDGSVLGFTDEQRTSFRAESTVFVKEAKAAKSRVDRKLREVAAFRKVMEDKGSQRAEALVDHFCATYLERGRTFFKNLEKLFSIPGREVRDVVLLLNKYTFRRNASFKMQYLKKPLTTKDVDNVYADVFNESKTGVWDIEPISKATLLDQGMTFHRSGLLIEGEYEDGGFPGFPDEAGLPLVSVVEYDASREVEMGGGDSGSAHGADEEAAAAEE